MEILKNYDTDVQKKIKDMNIGYNSHFFIYKDDENNKFKYTLKSFDDSDFYKTSYISQDYISSLRTKIVLNNRNSEINKSNKYVKLNNKLLKSLSYGIYHLFHDENWLRFDKDNFICRIDKDNINQIFCNTVNRSDLDKPQLINFVKTLQDLQFGVKIFNFHNEEDEEDGDEEDYDNHNVVWMVICDLI